MSHLLFHGKHVPHPREHKASITYMNIIHITHDPVFDHQCFVGFASVSIWSIFQRQFALFVEHDHLYITSLGLFTCCPTQGMTGC